MRISIIAAILVLIGSLSAHGQSDYGESHCVRSVELWTADDCPICVSAKRFLDEYGIPYDEYSFGPLSSAPLDGVPQFFIGGDTKLIGFDEEELWRELPCVR